MAATKGATNNLLVELRTAWRDAGQRRRRALWANLRDAEKEVIDQALEWIGNPSDLFPYVKKYDLKRSDIPKILKTALSQLRAGMEVAA